MAGTQLTPENIKSPIQLMAAWFAMLVLIESVLLTAVGTAAKPRYEGSRKNHGVANFMPHDTPFLNCRVRRNFLRAAGLGVLC